MIADRDPCIAVAHAGGDLDRSGRVGRRIVEHGVDELRHVVGMNRRVRGFTLDGDVGRPPPRHRLARKHRQVATRGSAIPAAGRHREQPGDEHRQPIDLRFGGDELRPDGVVAFVRDRALEPQLHPGERRAQLMRSVRDERLLRLGARLHPVGHRIERRRDLRDLRGAAHGTDPYGEIR